MDFPILTSERLLLRQFNENDLVNIFKGLSHPEIVKYYGVSYSDLESSKEQLEFFAEIEIKETGIWWAICSLDNSTFYGACGLNGWSKTHHRAEIGFWLLTEFWGKGIVLEASNLICNYGFQNLGLHRIEAIVETENSNCKKVMDKLGFSLEGTRRDCEFKDGKFISLDMYAKINGESSPEISI